MTRAIAVFGVVIGLATWLVVEATANHRASSQITAVPTATEPASTTEPVVPQPTLAAPTGITANRVNDQAVVLRWPAITLDGQTVTYRVWRHTTLIAAIAQTQFLDTGLAAGDQPSYSLSILSNTGQFSPTSETVTPVPAAQTPFPVSTPTPATNPNTNVSKPATQPKPTNTNSKPAPTPAAPAPTPTSSPACGSGGACTASQVATHNTRSNCWVYLSPGNKVYNVTAYVRSPGQHPGGDVIAPYCGQNIYNLFLGSAGGHRHSSRAQSELGAFYLGPFQP